VSRSRMLWLTPVLLTMLFPLVWMVFISVQPSAGGALSFDAFTRAGFTLKHYVELFREAAFARYVLNSALVAALVVTANVITAGIVGYALARSRNCS
jgi:ABC-type glycerol-3-phosphate transport system permease component